jgi:hypothetical protein
MYPDTNRDSDETAHSITARGRMAEKQKKKKNPRHCGAQRSGGGTGKPYLELAAGNGADSGLFAV